MHTRRNRSTGRQEQHIAVAQQRFGSTLVKNHARVHFCGNLESDTCGNIGLDQSGNDIDRGALRGQDQMDAGSPGLLRQPSDQFLDFFADYHHQVGEFVDDDDDEGQGGQVRHVLRNDTGHALCDFLHADRVFDGLAAVGSVFHFAIEAADVAYAERRHELVTPFHLRHAPAQSIGCLLHVGDHRRQ